MKKSFILFLSLLFVSTALVASKADDDAAAFVKALIGKANAENGYLNALRFFQYTATKEKENPSSYVLSKWGKEILEESGLKTSDKGKFLKTVSDRSGKRIEKLWKENKAGLLNLFSKEAYNSYLKPEIDPLIEFRKSAGYASMMKKMKAKSKKPGVKSIEAAGAVTQWSGYKDLAFWYRRDCEKNDKIVFEILKEIKNHYEK